MFAFRLALEVGTWDVPAMLDQMDPLLFRYWQAFFRLDPFGEQRADLRTGLLKQVLVNAFRDPDKDPVELEDCIPLFGMSDEERDEYLRERKRAKVHEKLKRLGGG